MNNNYSVCIENIVWLNNLGISETTFIGFLLAWVWIMFSHFSMGVAALDCILKIRNAMLSNL